MSISNKQRHILQLHGFIDREIEQVSQATTPDGRPQALNLDTPVWQAALNERLAYCLKKIEQGYNPYTFINTWHDRGRTRDIFTFIQEAYNKSMLGADSSVSSWGTYERRKKAKDKVRSLYRSKIAQEHGVSVSELKY